MIDFDAAMLGPIYATLGVSATLTIVDPSDDFDLTVIDKTGGVEVGENVEVPTIKPCAAIRISDLTALGLSKDDLIDGTLTFNGSSWTITNVVPKPVPNGERSGEIHAYLQKLDELASSES